MRYIGLDVCGNVCVWEGPCVWRGWGVHMCMCMHTNCVYMCVCVCVCVCVCRCTRTSYMHAYFLYLIIHACILSLSKQIFFPTCTDLFLPTAMPSGCQTTCMPLWRALFSSTDTCRSKRRRRICSRWRGTSVGSWRPGHDNNYYNNSNHSWRPGHNNYSNDYDNDNSNHIEGRSSRFFTISSLHHKLSPTRQLKWPGSNCVQCMYNTSSAYHVQHVVLPVTRYQGTAQLLSLTEFKSHLS